MTKKACRLFAIATCSWSSILPGWGTCPSSNLRSLKIKPCTLWKQKMKSLLVPNKPATTKLRNGGNNSNQQILAEKVVMKRNSRCRIITKIKRKTWAVFLSFASNYWIYARMCGSRAVLKSKPMSLLLEIWFPEGHTTECWMHFQNRCRKPQPCSNTLESHVWLFRHCLWDLRLIAHIPLCQFLLYVLPICQQYWNWCCHQERGDGHSGSQGRPHTGGKTTRVGAPKAPIG